MIRPEIMRDNNDNNNENTYNSSSSSSNTSNNSSSGILRMKRKGNREKGRVDDD